MSDIFSRKKRSKIMSAIRSSGNMTTELSLIKILRKNKIIGWTRKSKLPGKPDIVFPRQKIAVFLDGCFWHVCPKCFRMPTTNKPYWKKKFALNKKRDASVSRKLRQMRWRVIRIWEHEIENGAITSIKTIKKIIHK